MRIALMFMILCLPNGINGDELVVEGEPNIVERIEKHEAVRFLRRHKRSASEECREGCYREELHEVFNNWERSDEYMTAYKCSRYSCPQGCDNTNSNFGHINWLTVACKVNGGWSSWSAYGSCTVTCGGGYRKRYRSCNNPSPYNGGLTCSGSSSYAISCNTHNCPINGGWSSWSAYGSCTVKCGGGTSTKYRSCNNPSPSNGGLTCSGSSTYAVSCNTQNCPINGGFTSWSSWGSCSVTCGGGQQSKTRTCTNPIPQYGGLKCTGDTSQLQICNTQLCIVNGGWSSWSAYGSCTVTCGGGTSTRFRSCNNPSPSNGGLTCSGSTSDAVSCNTQNCPINGGLTSWSSWGSCSVTCGGGHQSKTRTCTNPTPQYGGLKCTGDTSQLQICNTQLCVVNGGWSSWSAYGSCTVTCGGGTSTKYRSCNNPSPLNGGLKCSGSSSDAVSCNTHNCPINGGFTSWSSWGSCSVTCGGGQQSKTRTCTNPTPQYSGLKCTGDTSQLQICNTQLCPVHGGWSSWSAYSSCTVTCGGGTSTKYRSCNNPSPANGGLNCSGSSSDAVSCNTHNCPINGGFTSWSSWGSCSVTCGGGQQSKTRTCTNPTPQYGGLKCTGDISQLQICNTQLCPVNGGWSSWSAYGSCTVTCGGGTSTKYRSCNNPSPSNGGLNCSGSSSDAISCNTHNCPINGGFTSWSSWGSCSVTCGGGQQSKTRTCTNPTPQYGGLKCTGDTSQLQICNTQLCPVNGGWSSWSAYSSCTITCGGGTSTKYRSCNNPSPSNGGLKCSGSTSDTVSCNTHNCPINGGLTSWSSWGSCSVTCGGGQQSKTRTCTNPTPQYGGLQCTGDTSQHLICNTQLCVVNGAWSNWNSWGSCHLSCGGGKRLRSRTCSNPAPANGGVACPGATSEYGDCNTQSCLVVAAGSYQQLCPSGWFTCMNGTVNCIESSFVCNCEPDCDDGSDEFDVYAGCDVCSAAPAVTFSFLILASSFYVMAFIINGGKSWINISV